MSETKKTGRDLLREPFPAHQIGKKPKPTKAQTDAVKQDVKKGRRCTLCGGWHHPDVVHLDYVGHAAVTDRLLDADPEWNWDPLAQTDDGLPLFDSAGGLWIRLTVCGTSRLGYGHADGKTGPDAIKEAIGDAIRNAAMRFGVALDLWHKGELHKPEEQPEGAPPAPEPPKEPITDERLEKAIEKIKAGDYTREKLVSTFALTPKQLKYVVDCLEAKE